MLLPFFAARVHWGAHIEFAACQDPNLYSTKLLSAYLMSSQYWGFLVIMFMVQDSVFTILTLNQISVISCLLFKPLYTAVQPSRPFFPICCHPQSCRGGVPPCQFFFPQFIPKCTLKLMIISLINPPSHYASSPFLQLSQDSCHSLQRLPLHWVTIRSLAPFPHMGSKCYVSSSNVPCLARLLFQDDVNLPYSLYLYYTYPGGDV